MYVLEYGGLCMEVPAPRESVAMRGGHTARQGQ